MSFRIFYACDVNGCKNTEQVQYSGAAAWRRLAPIGWLSLFKEGFAQDDRILICPEHVKMFPKRLEPPPPPPEKPKEHK